MAYINLQDMALEAYHHIEKKEFEQAESKLSYILNLHPDNPTMYYFLGCLFHDRKQFAFSVMAFEKAIAYNSDFDECYNNMAASYRQLGLMDKCKECFHRAIELASRPNYLLDVCKGDMNKSERNRADYLANLGSCYVARGTPAVALQYLNKAIEMMPGRPNSHWNAGLAYLELGDYKRGFEGYEYGDRISEDKERNYHGGPKSTRWWTGPVEGKRETIVVYGEQGIGDELMFASILPDVMKDANVIFECHPRLQNIFRQNFPGIPVYGTRKATQVGWLNNHKIDAKIAIGSLGKFYRQSRADFPGTPYIKCDEALLPIVADKIIDLSITTQEPLIGISWKGGIGITNKGNRRIPLELWMPIFEANPNAYFISLQYDSNAQAEIDAFHESIGRHVIHHWQNIVDDYDLTAALLRALDMVISVPQSVVHLAGAMGVKTLQLCPKQALWQMGPYGEDMPWYHSVHNFWQESDERWEPVIEEVVELLRIEEEAFYVNHR